MFEIIFKARPQAERSNGADDFNGLVEQIKEPSEILLTETAQILYR